MRVMMVFGLFVFSVPTATYDNIKRQVAWRHPSASRVGTRPSHQFLGQDDETITISGSVYPEISSFGRVSLEVLEAMGDSGKKYLLIGGDFKIYGEYVIESMDTERTWFFPDGTPRKIEFTLSLKRADTGSGLVMGLISALASKVISR